VAREIVANAAAANVRFMVHENFRFQPWHREIKRLINAGAIGDKMHSLHFRTRMGDGWGEDAYIPRQPYFRDYPRLLVYETGIHFIDTFRYLAGDISRVTGPRNFFSVKVLRVDLEAGFKRLFFVSMGWFSGCAER
jgi:predicted dehydrogenase